MILSLKNDVNVPSKKLRKKNIFLLRSLTKISGLGSGSASWSISQSSGMDPRIPDGSGSAPKFHGSTTHLEWCGSFGQKRGSERRSLSDWNKLLYVRVPVGRERCRRSRLSRSGRRGACASPSTSRQSLRSRKWFIPGPDPTFPIPKVPDLDPTLKQGTYEKCSVVEM